MCTFDMNEYNFGILNFKICGNFKKSVVACSNFFFFYKILKFLIAQPQEL